MFQSDQAAVSNIRVRRHRFYFARHAHTKVSSSPLQLCLNNCLTCQPAGLDAPSLQGQDARSLRLQTVNTTFHQQSTPRSAFPSGNFHSLFLFLLRQCSQVDVTFFSSIGITLFLVPVVFDLGLSSRPCSSW